MRMPFGKYKGHEVRTLPLDYQKWLLDNVKFYSKKLKEAIELDIWQTEETTRWSEEQDNNKYRMECGSCYGCKYEGHCI